MKKIDFAPEYKPYKGSEKTLENSLVYMSENTDEIICVGENVGFIGKNCDGYVVAPTNHANAVVMRRVFPFTAPVQALRQPCSIGVGDRLGVAARGHIELFQGYKAIPVLAQQSIRELTLTNRTYSDVLDCVTFANFKYNYTRGFGADGDHLKTEKEIEYALNSGFTMITLDCSEHIGKGADLEGSDSYLGEISVGKVTFEVDEKQLKVALQTYGEAINFIDKIYHKYILGNKVDFEISIDETATITTPFQHYFVANELNKRGVKFDTLAPRFVGEFQKGIDYKGDLAEFERQLIEHNEIAEHFGYKISVHSGSDKFSVFPIIGKVTKGRFHLKTAGTNWLEAVKLVAMVDPALFREIHKFALSVFDQATKYYHVTTDLNNIPDIDTLSDCQLVDLFNNNDARQLIHITYGLILGQKSTDGKFLFRDRLYELWNNNSAEYAKLIVKHIGKHLDLLGCEKL